MSEFLEIKEKYNELREKERIKLRDFLIKKGFENISQRSNAGKGKRNYTSGKRLTLPYNLSNWLYIEATLDEVNFFISFQSFDIDPCSKNLHSLTDRIGISFYTGKYNPSYISANMKITNIELPLDDEKMKQIYQIILEIATPAKTLSEIYKKYHLV